MKDRLTPAARLATARQVVCVEQPDWSRELLLALAALAIVIAGGLAALASGLAQLHPGTAERAAVEYWQERAGSEAVAVIRIERGADGQWRCPAGHVPHGWQRSIDAQCELLAALLPIHRASH